MKELTFNRPRTTQENFTVDGREVKTYENYVSIDTLVFFCENERIVKPDGLGNHVQCRFRKFKRCEGTVVTVSIPKYLYGNNLKNITPDEVRCAITHLSKLLDYDLEKAKIWRLDCGVNIEVLSPVRSYLPSMGEKPRFTRLNVTPTSLYYRTKQRELQFYDKLEEMKNKREHIPEEFKNKNILRSELRFKKRIQSQFKKYKKMTANVLFEDSFFQDLTDRFIREISFIEHKNVLIPQGEFKSKPSGALNMCLHILILEQKNPALFVRIFMEELRSHDFLFANRDYSTVEKKLQNMLSKPTQQKPETENVILSHILKYFGYNKVS